MNQQQLGQAQVQSQQQAMMHQVQQAAMAAQAQQNITQPNSQEQHHQQLHAQQQQHGQLLQQQQQQPQQTQQQAQQAQSQQQQQQQPPQQQQPDQKQDNISRVKHLYEQLHESVMETLRTAGLNINKNAHIDQGTKYAGDTSNAKFEESLEKFYSVCDQMELHLKTAIDHGLQTAASQRYTPNAINQSAGDNQKYAHYIATINSQVKYVKEIHSELLSAASKVSNITSSRTPNDHIASMETSN